MADHNRQRSIELNRASSTRSRIVTDTNDADVDDDFDSGFAISDGFRPVSVTQQHPNPSAPIPPQSRPSSISKPHPQRESFSLRHDGPQSRLSTISTQSHPSNFVRPETPYDGPSGPSHPYQMYPQDVRLARTASVATTSTTAMSERSYNGPRRPTHPYGIYPQGVAPVEVDLGHPMSRTNIVGFGTTDQYQRRIGLDGEEVADLIGPDGHLEQLPPYTRYPDHPSAQKAQSAATGGGASASSTTMAPALPALPASSSSATTALEVPGAGGIGLATRDPEFASTDDLGRATSSHSRRSVRSFVGSETSHHDINTAALNVTNEKSKKEQWKTAARHRVLGFLPCWCVALAMVALILLGVLLGVLIGLVLVPHGKNSKDDDHPRPYPDQEPESSGSVPLKYPPPGMQRLAEGSFALPLFNARQQNACFQDGQYYQTWNCDEIFSQLKVSVTKLDHVPPNKNYVMQLSYNESLTLGANYYSYGVQPPYLQNTIPLYLVNDTSVDTIADPSIGTAWFAQLVYNKTMLLPEQFISSTTDSTTAKFETRQHPPHDLGFHRKGIAHDGERPWICEWPGTELEVYIYVFQNSTGNEGSGFYPPHSGQDTGSDIGVPPSSTVSTASQTSSGPASTPTPDYFSPFPSIPLPLPVYPMVVKFNERRNSYPKGPAPTCRQVQIVENGVPAEPVFDEDNNPVEVSIELLGSSTDDDDDEHDERMHWMSRRNNLKSRDEDDGLGSNTLSDCGCIWILP